MLCFRERGSPILGQSSSSRYLAARYGYSGRSWHGDWNLLIISRRKLSRWMDMPGQTKLFGLFKSLTTGSLYWKVALGIPYFVNTNDERRYAGTVSVFLFKSYKTFCNSSFFSLLESGWKTALPREVVDNIAWDLWANRWDEGGTLACDRAVRATSTNLQLPLLHEGATESTRKPILARPEDSAGLSRNQHAHHGTQIRCHKRTPLADFNA